MESIYWIWKIVRDAALGWGVHNAPRLSAALAFYTILSVSPLLFIATALLGLVFGESGASDKLMSQMHSILGSANAEVFKSMVENSRQQGLGAIASVIGIMTLLFGASGVLTELQSALNTIWNVKAKPDNGFYSSLFDRAKSLAVVLAVGSLMIATVISSAIISAIGIKLLDVVPELQVLLRLANNGMSFVLLTILFALTFKLLPVVQIWWRDVWCGAIVTAILFTIGNHFIALYLRSAGIGTPFGASGSLVAFIVWMYYSSLILFFGAELTQVTATHLGHQFVPTENADLVSTSENRPSNVAELLSDVSATHPAQRSDFQA